MVAVQTAAQGPVLLRPGMSQMVVNQIQGMLDSLAGSYDNPVQQYWRYGQSGMSSIYPLPSDPYRKGFTQSLSGPPQQVPAALQPGCFGQLGSQGQSGVTKVVLLLESTALQQSMGNMDADKTEHLPVKEGQSSSESEEEDDDKHSVKSTDEKVQTATKKC